MAPVAEVSAGAWIGPRLGPFGGWVGSVVPRGFAAYARILHPVPDIGGEMTTWASVCAVTGREPHALMQWDAIKAQGEGDDPGPSRAWPGGDPEVGNLHPQALEALCRVLTPHTPDGRCIIGLWDGWGWIHGAPAVSNLSASRDGSPPAPAPVPPGPPDEVRYGPRLRLPGRDYLLFTGTLAAAGALGHQVTATWFIPQSPNLIWPPDQSWFVATEIDFDSTLIGGSAEVIAAVLADPKLESWPITATDSLASAADTITC